jgi:tetratricopeptide (TPR) repeat protein
LILDDLHWAAKPTLLLLRHLLRFGEQARVQIVGTYRSTDLDRSHPLAAMLTDLHRDGSASRLALGGLDEDEVSAYVSEAGYDDEDLARALASVTGGNPFFLIEALRHVAESGGRWDSNTLPQGVREAVSRRLSRLGAETNTALAAAAVVGSRFAVDLVERVLDGDLVDAFDEACRADIVIEEPGGRYRFNHALVRQSLLAELPSVRRMRLHQRIATTLEAASGGDDELLAELAHHYFECAWAGNAAKAVEYCRRAGDQAIERLAYEGAAEMYDRALHALEELDDELPDRGALQAELLVARCEALLAAGDVGSAAGAVAQLRQAAGDSVRLTAWGTCFDGQLSMLTDPERLDEVEAAVGAAAEKLAGLADAAGEAKAHTVRAACLARLGRFGDAETALDQALTAARRAHDHRRVNAVLAGAPLAALWGPNPVPRAGGRCLDVVRLLRITTGSPVVEATSTRCQGVLDALRGRAAAGRALIDSARRSLTELGMRHALLEVEQFAGLVELVADEPAAAEPLLRRACDGFRRMGLDADTAETAAFLARACLALDRDAEADELCIESEHLAGHVLKPSITWRTVRAQLLARTGEHDEARRVAEEAVRIAERTDALVDHGDACLVLAMVLNSAGDTAGARTAAEQAVALFERKGAAALAAMARTVLGQPDVPTARDAPELSSVVTDNECVRVMRLFDAAYDRDAWDEIEQHVAAVVFVESRRKIVGLSLGDVPRSEWITEAKTYREVMAPVRYRHKVIAVRGEQLALTSLQVGPTDQSPGAPRDELLQLYGLDQEGRFALQIWFDPEDIDAAFEELDACYRAGEAAAYADTWSAITKAYGVFNRHEVPPTTPGWVNIDHRRGIAFTPGEQTPYMQATFDVAANVSFYAEQVHRLGALGAVVTQAGHGTSQDGVDAEWREVCILTVEGERLSHCEIFDEADLDAALALFDEIDRPSCYLENAASQAYEHVKNLFPTRDWDGIGELLADDISSDDRRKVVNSGVLRGRAACLSELSGIAEVGLSVWTSDVIAVRGERVVFNRARVYRDGQPGAFGAEVLDIIETDADGRIKARIVFDPDDFDAAYAELDARYVAGEAADYARTWSAVTRAFSAVDSQERPRWTPNALNIDHRRGSPFGPGDLYAVVSMVHDGTTHLRNHIEAVHCLNDVGAVVTQVSRGTGEGDFEAEWRMLTLMTVDGGLLNRCELFDESDLGAALSRFDELSLPITQLDNVANRMVERYLSRFATREWDLMAQSLAEEFVADDRRRVVNSGVRHGRDNEVQNFKTMAEIGCSNITSRPMATRGARLVLARHSFTAPDWPEMDYETIDVVETDEDDKFIAEILYEPEDFAVAISELDARYLAGEAAAYADAWTVVSTAYTLMNQRKIPPTTPGWVNIDHRHGTTFAPGDMTAYVRAAWDDLEQDLQIYIEAVHRLTTGGTVVTQVLRGTTRDGFEAEWRTINLFTVKGELFDRCELFDESDLDWALSRFDELSRPRRLENTASRVEARCQSCIAARDWDAMAAALADDVAIDDRRRVVNAGVRRGRQAVVDDLRVGADVGLTQIRPTPMAIRGERLTLCHIRYGSDQNSDAGLIDLLQIVEIDTDERIAALVLFDPDALEAALEELEARYIVGEAANHERAWSVIAENCATLNLLQFPPTTTDFTYSDRRRIASIGASDMKTFFRAAWELTPNLLTFVESVHRLSDFGAVVTQTAHGNSPDGFYAEWRVTIVYTLNDGLQSRCEVFDEDDFDAAIARFDELESSRPL